MKFNDVKRFSAYVRTKYHSEYITVAFSAHNIIKFDSTKLKRVFYQINSEQPEVTVSFGVKFSSSLKSMRSLFQNHTLSVCSFRY